MGKAIALVLGKWVLQGPSLELGSPLEVELPLEVEPSLEVASGDGIGQAKRVQGELEMVPGQGL